MLLLHHCILGLATFQLLLMLLQGGQLLKFQYPVFLFEIYENMMEQILEIFKAEGEQDQCLPNGKDTVINAHTSGLWYFAELLSLSVYMTWVTL
jgi:hypothetical protein